MAKKELDVAQQQFGWEQTTNVSKAMIKAGSTPGKSRIKEGVKAAWRAKTSSMYGEDTTKGAIALRLFGFSEIAKWYDRFLATESKKSKPTSQDGGDSAAASSGRSNIAAKKTLVLVATGFKQVKGELTTIDSRLNRLSNIIIKVGEAIGSVHQDVKDIKSLIMPKKIMARGGAFTDEWGRENTKSVGNIQLAHYNPLAPAGSQFVQSKSVRPKGWRKGLTVHGGPTSKPIEKGFLQSAIKQASIQTAILVLRMEKRDRERAEEDKKRQEELDQFKYKDEEESKIRDPLDEFKKHVDERFDDLEKKIGDNAGQKKGGIFDWIGNMFSGLWDKIKDFFKGGLAILGGLAGLVPMAGLLLGKAGLVGIAGVLGYAVGTWLNDKFQLDVKINDAIEKALGWFGKGEKAKREAADAAAVAKLNVNSKEVNKKLEGTGYTHQGTVSSYDKKGNQVFTGGGYLDSKGNKVLEKDLPNEVKTKLGIPAPQPRTRSTGMRNVRRKDRTSGQTSWVNSVNNTGTLMMPDQTIKEIILAASKRVGVDAGIMLAMAKQESSFNPNAKAGTSSAKGLYQFLNSTWADMVKKYGDSYPELNNGQMDPMASALAGALFIKENGAVLSKAGIPIDGTSIYAAHFLGAGGAKKLFSADPDTDATRLMPKPAEANRHIFYNRDGSPRTVAQVQDALFEKVGKYATLYSESLGESTPTMASVVPAKSSSGATLDQGNRQLQAANAPANGGVMVVKGPTINNQTNNTVGKRPAAKADVVSRDEALMRVAGRDSRHPVYG